MPLTISRAKAAQLLGWSPTTMNQKTELGEVAVVWMGARRKITIGEIARVAGITSEEVAARYADLFADDAA